VDSALPLILFLACMFAGVLLILAMGIASRERARALSEAAPSAARDWVGVPRFFARLGPQDDSRGVPAVNGSVLARIERYLEVERLLADEFVAAPSVRRLYGHSRNGGLPRDPSLERIEAHLRREQVLATRFVAEPTIERLHERSVEPQLALN